MVNTFNILTTLPTVSFDQLAYFADQHREAASLYFAQVGDPHGALVVDNYIISFRAFNESLVLRYAHLGVPAMFTPLHTMNGINDGIFETLRLICFDIVWETIKVARECTNAADFNNEALVDQTCANTIRNTLRVKRNLDKFVQFTQDGVLFEAEFRDGFIQDLGQSMALIINN